MQTADFFAAALKPAEGVHLLPGIGPMDDVKSFAAQLDSGSGAMYVGHLPFMEKLTGFLVAQDENNCVCKFQNGGIVCLDQDGERGWFIRWTLLPDIR